MLLLLPEGIIERICTDYGTVCKTCKRFSVGASHVISCQNCSAELCSTRDYFFTLHKYKHRGHNINYTYCASCATKAISLEFILYAWIMIIIPPIIILDRGFVIIRQLQPIVVRGMVSIIQLIMLCLYHLFFLTFIIVLASLAESPFLVLYLKWTVVLLSVCFPPVYFIQTFLDVNHQNNTFYYMLSWVVFCLLFVRYYIFRTSRM